MMILINLILSAIAVFATAYLLPGVTVDSFVTALVVAVVLGVLNAVVKPVLLLLTLPITILTLGLFSLVINIVMILVASAVVPGFEIAGLVPAILFGLVLSLISSVFSIFTD